MKITEIQKEQIKSVFIRAEVFISKLSRNAIFDIEILKYTKEKIAVGIHLECYTKQDGKPKHVDIQVWAGKVKDFKEESLDDFVCDTEFNDKNSLEFENIKLDKLQSHLSEVYFFIENYK